MSALTGSRSKSMSRAREHPLIKRYVQLGLGAGPGRIRSDGPQCDSLSHRGGRRMAGGREALSALSVADRKQELNVSSSLKCSEMCAFSRR